MDVVDGYFGFRQSNVRQPRLDIIPKKDFEMMVGLPNLCDADAIERASRPLKETPDNSRTVWTEPHAFEQLVDLAKRSADKIQNDSNHCMGIDRLGCRLLNSTSDRYPRWGLVWKSHFSVASALA